MKHVLPTVILSLIAVCVSAQFDLPPPPGYEASDGQKARSRAAQRHADSMHRGRFTFSDPEGDVMGAKPFHYLDIVRLTLIPMTETDTLVSIDFADPMPAPADAKVESIIFFSLDLDQDVTTGKAFAELGVDTSIKFKGRDNSQPWIAEVKEHSKPAMDCQLSVHNLFRKGNTLGFLLRTEGPKNLDQFNLYIGALADYQTVDAMPALRIDLASVRL
ncbi:hypothetical protein [Cerasicoccus frondis]|uniref:hypothetical protein n=1 Tax=Cerasicoccus frondis TaxID=490090 RepID=UPI002852888B|nr:hypothetical protein [Cerasicoccus frondis]